MTTVTCSLSNEWYLSAHIQNPWWSYAVKSRCAMCDETRPRRTGSQPPPPAGDGYTPWNRKTPSAVRGTCGKCGNFHICVSWQSTTFEQLWARHKHKLSDCQLHKVQCYNRDENPELSLWINIPKVWVFIWTKKFPF